MARFPAILSLAAAVGIGLSAFQNCSTNLETPGQGSNASQAALQVTVNKKPPEITAVGDATFEFTSNEPNATFECAAFGRAFGLCFSPLELKALDDGTYTVEIRAVSADGKASAPFKHTWEVNRSALSTSITSTMPPFTNLRTANIAFVGFSTLGSIMGYECKVNMMDFQPCVSPLALAGLGEGETVVEVRTRESNGQFSQPARISWRIDLTAPLVSIANGPLGDAYPSEFSNTVTFTFNSLDAGGSQLAGTFCRLDNQPEVACTNNATYTVNADGIAHTFFLRATDRAGNSTTVSRTFTHYYNPPTDNGGGN